MSLQDVFNDNDGLINAAGHFRAIDQRNRMIAQQRENAAAIREQTAALEKANRIEADRVKLERQRIEIEQERLKAEELEREMRREQAEKLKFLRGLLAASFATLERLQKIRPAN